jgi:lysophospholipase L1-like esterase
MKQPLQKKLILSAGVFLISLLIAELTVRAFSLGPEFAAVYWENYRLSENPSLGYELVPGSKDGDLEINSDSMRDRERTPEKPPETIRIACIGDSICYGLEVPRADTFPARLEKILNEYYSHTGISFEVMNFGVTGYNMKQTIENLRSRALKYKPDLIIYAYCLNEPQEYSFEMASILSMMTDAERQYTDSRLSRSLSSSRLYALLRYVLRSRTSGGMKKGRRPDLKKDEKVWASLYSGTYPKYFTALYSDEATWKPIEAGFSELADISRENNAPVFVAVFPVLMHFDRYPLAHLHTKVSQACRQNALETIDLLELLSQYELLQKKRVGWDALHPNKDGHGVVALGLFMELIRREPLRNLPQPAAKR